MEIPGSVRVGCTEWGERMPRTALVALSGLSRRVGETVNPPIGRSILLRSDLYYAPSSCGYRLDDHIVGVTADRPVEAAPAGDEP